MFNKTNPTSIAVVSAAVLLIVLASIGLPRPCAAAGPRTITDMIGRQVTVPATVNRIVTTFKPVTLCILSLGLQDKIIGIDSHSKRDRLTLAVSSRKPAALKAWGSKSTRA